MGNGDQREIGPQLELGNSEGRVVIVIGRDVPIVRVAMGRGLQKLDQLGVVDRGVVLARLLLVIEIVVMVVATHTVMTLMVMITRATMLQSEVQPHTQRSRAGCDPNGP